MKLLGLEFYIDCFGIDIPTGEATMFFPFPNVRRYEKLVVSSTKKEKGKINHEDNTIYKMKYHRDPISLQLSRFSTVEKLSKKNEKSLQNQKSGEKVKSIDYLFSK